MVSQNKKCIFQASAANGVIRDGGQWDVSVGLHVTSRSEMSSKGEGCLLLHPLLLLLPVCWNSDMMAGPQESFLTTRRKLHAEGGVVARYKELGSLTALWHCFTSPDLLTFGIPSREYAIHENVPDTPSSTGRVTDQRCGGCTWKLITAAVSGSLPTSFYSGISFNKALTHLIPFFGLWFPENLN